MQILIPLTPGGGPLSRQVYGGLRRAVLDGALRVGDRLPSTRDLAEQLGVSRTVVVTAFDQLLAEGFVEGRVGSGTYVATEVRPSRAGAGARRAASAAATVRLSRFGAFAAAAAATVEFPARGRRAPRYDFAYGRSDVERFPFEVWRRLLARRARALSVRQLDYGPPAGSPALCQAIAGHLGRARAVVCEPEQVIVVNGSQQALDLIARVLVEPGDRVLIEEPSYQGTREILRAARARLLPIAVDRDGIDPRALPDAARLAVVTPSHQFPTGAVLSLARRLELLSWARRAEAVIVEDDYDGEFRYAGRPLESLQGLDREGRVVYVGTFSRTVFSALRIGYLVVPKGLIGAFAAAKWLCDRHTATLEQETLAAFIEQGHYERHLRRVRRQNAATRDALLAAIDQHLANRVEVTGGDAGAHVVVWPTRKVSEDSLVAAAAEREVGVYGVGRYYQRKAPRPGLLLGYSRMNANDVREGVRRLAGLL
jgi:GntR family transcriptional regulator/MocR family aminotransferase